MINPAQAVILQKIELSSIRTMLHEYDIRYCTCTIIFKERVVPVSAAMSAFQVFRTTIMSLNQQYVASDVVDETRIVAAF